MKLKSVNFFSRVYEVIRKIPKGKVATYGQVAYLVGTKDARKVGWALHANKDENTPCHRVVNSNGKLADSFAFGGAEEQKSRLEREGVEFIDKTHADLKKSLWREGR